MRGFGSVLSIALFGIALCAWTAGCGGDAAVDERANPDTVFSTALTALSSADLPTLHRVLTPRARSEFQSNLRAFHDALGLKPDARASLERLIEARFPGETQARVRAAREGGPHATLALLVAIRPVVVPEQPRMRGSDTARSYYYLDAQRVEREVRLVKGADGWVVERLEL